jgi:hypothetical protein
MMRIFLRHRRRFALTAAAIQSVGHEMVLLIVLSEDIVTRIVTRALPSIRW